MQDYPGVDPDGLSPGGLLVAGKVNASDLEIQGQSVNSGRVGTSLYLSGTQSIVAGQVPIIAFDTIEEDTTNSADLANNGIKVSRTGLYVASLGTILTWAVSPTGTIALQVLSNSSDQPDYATQTILPSASMADREVFTWLFSLFFDTATTIQIAIANNSDQTLVVHQSLFCLASVG